MAHFTAKMEALQELQLASKVSVLQLLLRICDL